MWLALQRQESEEAACLQHICSVIAVETYVWSAGASTGSRKLVPCALPTGVSSMRATSPAPASTTFFATCICLKVAERR